MQKQYKEHQPSSSSGYGKEVDLKSNCSPNVLREYQKKELVGTLEWDLGKASEMRCTDSRQKIA